MTVNPAIKFLAAAALLCAGCGSATSTTAPTSTASPTATAAAASKSTSSAPGSSAARGPASSPETTVPGDADAVPSGSAPESSPVGSVNVRLVNLYAPSDHPAGVSLNGFLEGDTVLGAGAVDGTGRPTFGTVAYGQVSDYRAADPSKIGDLVLFVAGQLTPVAISNIDGSVPGRYTLVAYANDQPGQASVDGFDETPTASDVAQRFPGSLSAAPDGKVLLVADGGPLHYIGDRDGYNLGEPGKGCFALQVPDGPSSGQTNIPTGGSLTYVADPGSMQVAFFPSSDGTCSQAPVIGPISITAVAGDRLFVVAYGVSPAAITLLSIPVRAVAGDAPLVPGPTTTTGAPVSTVDPCSVITSDQASTALGAAVDDSTADTSQGTCTFTAGATVLTIAIQSDMTRQAFDLIASGDPNADHVSGLGDVAVFTSDPGGIVVLQGTTILAVVLDHHGAAGPDDANVDRPLLEQVAAIALQAL
jgi:hypothetical protein